MENLVEFVVNYWWIGLLAFGLIILLFAKRLGNTFGGGVIEIKAAQAVELIEQQQAILIDLAEKTTFEKGHIPGALSMPGVTFIDGTVMPLKDNSKPIILIPMKGLIPMPVIQHLESEGVPVIYILKGGLNAWKQAGFPL
jgi:rhodanese-related sulfurtransferase